MLTLKILLIPFPASHNFCGLLSHVLMFRGSLYCKQQDQDQTDPRGSSLMRCHNGEQSNLGSIRLQCRLSKNINRRESTGPRSAVGNESDCRFRGCDFQPGPVPCFHGD